MVLGVIQVVVPRRNVGEQMAVLSAHLLAGFRDGDDSCQGLARGDVGLPGITAHTAFPQSPVARVRERGNWFILWHADDE